MASITFISNPTVGQEYTAENGQVYTWTGNKWQSNATLGSGLVALPANSSGYLTNDGTGNLSWDAVADGAQGPAGPKGDTGETGAQGPAGPNGLGTTTGSWTLAAGANTVSLTVPINGTYSIWVRGNIPNGIVTYTATAVVTNTNVPVVGSSYGWYYAAGNALVLTSIPTQFVGTVNNISNAEVSTTTANVFTFGITNNSGSSQVVNWGYVQL
jgi:hypothetical protein